MGKRVATITLFLIFMSIVTNVIPAQAEYYSEEVKEPLFQEYTRPTFGIDYETNRQLVDGGFKINNQTFDITNNFHTPFALYNIEIGNLTSFETILYAPKGLQVQEFLFGIPNAGQAHLAEIGIEIWYDLEGEITNYKVVQRTNVVDENQIFLNHDKVKCNKEDENLDCDHTQLSLVFLEPLKDKVMAIKAIDFKKRYQITYLNEGVNLSGEQISPNLVKLIPSTKKYEGLIPVTQIEKYSSRWVSEDGRIFEQNSFGSFNQVDLKFERFQDEGDPKTRLHSGFAKLITNEQTRAQQIFDSRQIISELPGSFTIDMPIGERITKEIKETMLEQEQIAKKIIEDSDRQIREY